MRGKWVVALKKCYIGQQMRKRGDRFRVRKTQKMGTCMRELTAADLQQQRPLPEEDQGPALGDQIDLNPQPPIAELDGDFPDDDEDWDDDEEEEEDELEPELPLPDLPPRTAKKKAGKKKASKKKAAKKVG